MGARLTRLAGRDTGSASLVPTRSVGTRGEGSTGEKVSCRARRVGLLLSRRGDLSTRPGSGRPVRSTVGRGARGTRPFRPLSVGPRAGERVVAGFVSVWQPRGRFLLLRGPHPHPRLGPGGGRSGRTSRPGHARRRRRHPHRGLLVRRGVGRPPRLRPAAGRGTARTTRSARSGRVGTVARFVLVRVVLRGDRELPVLGLVLRDPLQGGHPVLELDLLPHLQGQVDHRLGGLEPDVRVRVPDQVVHPAAGVGQPGGEHPVGGRQGGRLGRAEAVPEGRVIEPAEDGPLADLGDPGGVGDGVPAGQGADQDLVRVLLARGGHGALRMAGGSGAAGGPAGETAKQDV
ncbi:MAG: hypothetical protein JWO38_1372 [Gemmataceae bacterium]|nr:hypothetical protein [Gemmataceae bacterium]